MFYILSLYKIQLAPFRLQNKRSIYSYSPKSPMPTSFSSTLMSHKSLHFFFRSNQPHFLSDEPPSLFPTCINLGNPWLTEARNLLCFRVFVIIKTFSNLPSVTLKYYWSHILFISCVLFILQSLINDLLCPSETPLAFFCDSRFLCLGFRPHPIPIHLQHHYSYVADVEIRSTSVLDWNLP